MAKMVLIILGICTFYSKLQKAVGLNRLMEIEGSNREVSDLWVVVINHRKKIKDAKQKDLSEEHQTKTQKKYLKKWLKSALHEGGNVQHPSEKEGTFQLRLKGKPTPFPQLNEERAEQQLKELKIMHQTILMLQKSLLIWARV